MAVARNLFKLMAYKDEYEVARLHTDKAFHERIASQFEGDFKLRVHLAPPLLAKKNAKGELIKQTYGPFMFTAFGWLAKFKGLRGTALDVFGYTEERRTERALIGEYRNAIEALLDRPRRRQPTHWRSKSPGARADQGLWPCERPQPGRGAQPLGRVDGALGGRRCGRSGGSDRGQRTVSHGPGRAADTAPGPELCLSLSLSRPSFPLSPHGPAFGGEWGQGRHPQKHLGKQRGGGIQ